MKKFSFKAVALAASFIASSTAFAAISLDAATTPNKYASELKIGASGIALLDGADTDLNLSAAHGVSPGVNVTSYVRIDLSNGATFKTNSPTLAVSNGVISATGAGTGSLSSGGAGASFVIFALSPTNPAHSIQADGTVTLTVDAAGINVLNSGTVTARMRVYETLTAAANPDSSLSLKDTTARNFITFTPALTASVSKGALVADVNPAVGDAYTKFTPHVAAGSAIGQVTYTLNAAAAANGVNIAALGTLLAATNDVTVTGDLSFIKGSAEAYTDTAVKNRVFLNAASNCAGATAATTSKTVSATGATFAGVAAADLASMYVCVVPETTVAIPAGSYTTAVATTAQAAYTVNSLATTALGDISRNGTTLVAPITNQPTGWYSRLVLNNTSTVDRTYTVKAVSETGNVITLSGAAASGTLKANSTTVADLQSLVTAVGGLPRYSLVVTVNAPTSAINGAYQIANGTTGMISNYTLIAK